MSSLTNPILCSVHLTTGVSLHFLFSIVHFRWWDHSTLFIFHCLSSSHSSGSLGSLKSPLSLTAVLLSLFVLSPTGSPVTSIPLNRLLPLRKLSRNVDRIALNHRCPLVYAHCLVVSSFSVLSQISHLSSHLRLRLLSMDAKPFFGGRGDTEAVQTVSSISLISRTAN